MNKQYYIVLEAPSSSALANKVNGKNEEGYIVTGGIQTYVVDGKREVNTNYRPKIPKYVQAMILTSSDD